MKQKRIKSAAVALIALLIVGAAIFGLNIEPADEPATDAITAGEKVETGQQTDGREEKSVDEADSVQTREDGKNEEETQPVSDEKSGGEGSQKADSETPVPSKDGKTSAPEADKAPADEKKAMKCTFEIRCDTLTDHSKVTNEAILPYIPDSGVILAATEVEFNEGDTVFDALQKVTRQKEIQMEFRHDKLYTGGAYIEGINYLYEFDGGPLSGWMYKVNGQFPNYGCAGYTLKQGDEVVWVYTCDLGTDVGDNSTW